MSAIMQFLEAAFTPLVFIFTMTNLFYMGLEVEIDSVLTGLKNKKAIALIIVWSWVLGPALAYLIAWVLLWMNPMSSACSSALWRRSQRTSHWRWKKLAET